MSIFTRAFWAAATERAVKTAAQSAILTLAADQVNVLTADWVTVAGFAGGGFILSVLTSLASNGAGGIPGPSLANEYTIADAIIGEFEYLGPVEFAPDPDGHVRWHEGDTEA